MTGHRKWRDLRRHGSPEHEAASAEWVAQESARIGDRLRDIRRAREMTQVALSQEMGISQTEISRIEHQADLYLSTLQRYAASLGGQLEVTIRFDDLAFPIALSDNEGTDERATEPGRSAVAGN